MENSLFFSYFTKFSSSSYWLFGCSATSDEISFSEKSFSARALKQVLLCSGCLIMFIGAKHEAFLARQEVKGDFLQSWRTRSNTSCLHRPLNFLFSSAEICDFSKISLVAALRSTNSSCKWYFILGSHFLVNLFNSMPVLSRASFLNISCNSSDIYLCNRLFVTCILEYY